MQLNLGTKTIPDGVGPKLQQVFGGTTPAQTQQAIQRWAWARLRAYALSELHQRRQAAMAAADAAALLAAQEADEQEWAEEEP